MIFTKEHIEKIRRGEKTETRRIWKFAHVKVGGVYGTRASRREKEKNGLHIRVTDVHTERLGDMTVEAVRREGFQQPIEFVEVWMKLHNVWDANQQVYVVRFELVA